MAIEIDVSRLKYAPFPHQMDGMVSLIRNKSFALFDEMGVGKTKQTIDAACWLYDKDYIDTVVIVAPAGVKSVWADKELGEIVKHCWVRARITEYRNGRLEIPYEEGRLMFVVASYELLRMSGRLDYLMRQLRGRRTMLVCDESSFVSNHKALQTRSIMKLRQECSRCVILNGTPGEPVHLYSQFAIMDKLILKMKNFYAFRARYCKMGGFQRRQIVGYNYLEELQARTRPYCLRRRKEDVMKDLLPKMYQFREVCMEEDVWKMYKEMRDEAIVFLEGKSTMAPHAITKMLRLGQLTSGILGGLCDDDGFVEDARMVSTKKADYFVDWAESCIREGQRRIIVWCRFIPEMDYVTESLGRIPGLSVFAIRGGQSKSRRDEAKAEFQAGDMSRPAVLVGQQQAGGMGLTLTTAYTVAYLSNDYSLKNRLQSEDRVHRPGQTHQCVYTDFITCGPSGQKTFDHQVLKALRKKDDISKWTASQWRKALTEE